MMRKEAKKKGKEKETERGGSQVRGVEKRGY